MNHIEFENYNEAELRLIAKKMINTLYPNNFDYIQGDLPELPKKPDPYLLNKVINEFDIDKSDVTYVGDSEVDIETANTIS